MSYRLMSTGNDWGLGFGLRSSGKKDENGGLIGLHGFRALRVLRVRELWALGFRV